MNSNHQNSFLLLTLTAWQFHICHKVYKRSLILIFYLLFLNSSFYKDPFCIKLRRYTEKYIKIWSDGSVNWVSPVNLCQRWSWTFRTLNTNTNHLWGFNKKPGNNMMQRCLCSLPIWSITGKMLVSNQRSIEQKTRWWLLIDNKEVGLPDHRTIMSGADPGGSLIITFFFLIEHLISYFTRTS